MSGHPPFKALDDSVTQSHSGFIPFTSSTPQNSPYQKQQRPFYRRSQGHSWEHNRSFPTLSDSQSFREARRGSFYGSARNNRGGDFTPRGYFPRGRRSFRRDFRSDRVSQQSLFHPSMLEDPWADLICSRDDSSMDQGMSSSSLLSDSLIPQVGDSLVHRNAVNPAPDVECANLNDQSCPSVTDSTTPLIGDSFVQSMEEPSS